jgi:hypothetical protein
MRVAPPVRVQWRFDVTIRPYFREQLLHNLLSLVAFARASVVKIVKYLQALCLLGNQIDVITVVNLLAVHFCLYIHVSTYLIVT